MSALYDTIGKAYAGPRRSDPRIAAAIDAALAGCRSVLNVGAGTGSYEPAHLDVVAVEPSRTMIAQRPPGAARCVQAAAEDLPFADGSFDAVLAVMTVHHWRDLARGFAECARVARRRVLCLTTDMDVFAGFWLFDYLPELIRVDRAAFPSMARFGAAFDDVTVAPVPIPADCVDGFLGAYWRRPEAYLEPALRASISTFARLADDTTQAGLARLDRDMRSGAWAARYPDLAGRDGLDLGYRLVTASAGADATRQPAGPAGAPAMPRGVRRC